MRTRTSARSWLSALVIALLVACTVIPVRTVKAAACQVPPVDYGTATSSLPIQSTATYRLWTRMMVPDGVNSTYLLEIDGTTCYNVGGGNIASNVWVWVDYHTGVATNKVQQSLATGNHSIKFVGNKPGVKIDRLIAISDPNCVPTGLGENCNAPDPPADITAPSVSLTSPQSGATVSGNVTLAASASDNLGVSRVEFYTNTTLVGSDSSAPYSVTVATTDLINGSHLITARAYDAAGNMAVDSRSVTVSNGDTAAPTTPANVKAAAQAYNKVLLTWTASTDNVGVTGYTIVRDGVTIASAPASAAPSYQDVTAAPNTLYRYQVGARDAAGNKSSLSAVVGAQTPDVPDVESPSAPADVVATALNTSQINLVWTASTDNIGVIAYDVYRGTSKVATVTGTSFGDSGLRPHTNYTYTVQARDAAGNTSAASVPVSAATKPEQTQKNGMLSGTIRTRSGRPLSGVSVVAIPAGTSNRIVTKTGSDGRYRIVFSGTFTGKVKYSKDGYRTERAPVLVEAGQIVKQRVTLTRR